MVRTQDYRGSNGPPGGREVPPGVPAPPAAQPRKSPGPGPDGIINVDQDDEDVTRSNNIVAWENRVKQQARDRGPMTPGAGKRQGPGLGVSREPKRARNTGPEDPPPLPPVPSPEDDHDGEAVSLSQEATQPPDDENKGPRVHYGSTDIRYRSLNKVLMEGAKAAAATTKQKKTLKDPSVPISNKGPGSKSTGQLCKPGTKNSSKAAVKVAKPADLRLVTPRQVLEQGPTARMQPCQPRNGPMDLGPTDARNLPTHF